MQASLASPTATIARLQELGLSTKKSFGQHFLIDGIVLKRILDLADLSQGDTVIEIGPGIGTLTLALQERVARVIAIEFDEALVMPLRELVDPSIVTVIHADAARLLRDEPEMLPQAVASKMVANLPYQIGATVILRSFEVLDRMESATVMVQREVADRIRAHVKTKDYGAYTVKLALLARPAGSFDVSPASFLPPPRVDSTVLHLERHPLVRDTEHYHATRRVVDQAFSMRRKMLRNNLRPLASVQLIESACASIGIDPSARAESLEIEQFIALADTLTAQVG